MESSTTDILSLCEAFEFSISSFYQARDCAQRQIYSTRYPVVFPFNVHPGTCSASRDPGTKITLIDKRGLRDTGSVRRRRSFTSSTSQKLSPSIASPPRNTLLCASAIHTFRRVPSSTRQNADNWARCHRTSALHGRGGCNRNQEASGLGCKC